MRLIDQIKNKRILVVGDVMLDVYDTGSVGRISPEAPVPIFLKKETIFRTGGAANVAVNMAANKQSVSVLSVIGRDDDGRKLRALLKESGIDDFLLLEANKPTTTKRRLIAGGNQQVLRVDSEDTTEIDAETEEELLSALKGQIGRFDVVIISDYMKGLLTFGFTQRIIGMANQASIRVLADVKDQRAEKYAGAYLIKPNTKELQMLTGMPVETEKQIKEASLMLCRRCGSKYVLTTRSAKGMMLVEEHGACHSLKTTSQEVFDVTGAGDTVIAYLAMCMASGMDITEAMNISNYAAGIQVSKVGTSVVRLSEVARVATDGYENCANSNKRLECRELKAFREEHLNKTIVFTNGCFDILHVGHIRYLKKAATLGDILVIGINSDDSVRRLKGTERPINTQEERLEVLSALEFVDYVVIFEEDTPYTAIEACQPDVLVKGGDWSVDNIVGRDIVEARGGKVLSIPYVEGKSTSDIIERIREKV